jgi:hypothetical protein
MSQALPTTVAPPRRHSYRRWLAAPLAAVAVAAAVGIPILAQDNQTAPASQTRSTTEPTSGPNETARGQAAATSAGVASSPRTGGPNEDLRGQSAHSASR